MAKQTEQFHFYATKDEAELIHKRMEESGMKNKCAYLREMALNGYMVNVDVTDVKEMTGLLGRYGNNINQIARRANESGSVSTGDVRMIQNQMKELYDMLRRILNRISDIF
ncbi:MAG: plasmid mobilization protein [Candidatus Weimeria sp.]